MEQIGNELIAKWQASLISIYLLIIMQKRILLKISLKKWPNTMMI